MNEDFDIRNESVTPAEKEFEKALRPLKFSDFSGQSGVVDNLEIFVEAAKYRGEPLDHTLLHGPPGLGKTTLSNIIANELGVGFKITSGPVLDKPGDLAGILTSLEPNDVLSSMNPPSLASCRGVSLFGDGGLPHRHHDRQGTFGKKHPDRSEPFHAGGRYNQKRTAHSPSPCPFRHQSPSGVL